MRKELSNFAPSFSLRLCVKEQKGKETFLKKAKSEK